MMPENLSEILKKTVFKSTELPYILAKEAGFVTYFLAVSMLFSGRFHPLRAGCRETTKILENLSKHIILGLFRQSR
jgi:hypothetical protein